MLVSVVLLSMLCSTALALVEPAQAASSQPCAASASIVHEVEPGERTVAPTELEISLLTEELKGVDEPDIFAELTNDDVTVDSSPYTIEWQSGLTDGSNGMVYYTEKSNLHWGWASPRDTYQMHYNVHTWEYSPDLTYSREVSNWHVYQFASADGVWHYCAYDSVTGTFKEYTFRGPSQPTADTLRNYVKSAVQTATFGAIILASLYITWQFVSTYGWVILMII